MADVDALLERMSAAQIAGWLAFAELEPFGPLREDQRAASVACAVVNNIPLRGKGVQALKPADLFQSLAPPFKPQTVEQMVATAKQSVLSKGGKVKTIKRDAPNGRQARRPRNRSRGR